MTAKKKPEEQGRRRAISMQRPLFEELAKQAASLGKTTTLFHHEVICEALGLKILPPRQQRVHVRTFTVELDERQVRISMAQAGIKTYKDLCSAAGLSTDGLCRWLRGADGPKGAYEALARALGVRVEAILQPRKPGAAGPTDEARAALTPPAMRQLRRNPTVSPTPAKKTEKVAKKLVDEVVPPPHQRAVPAIVTPAPHDVPAPQQFGAKPGAPPARGPFIGPDDGDDTATVVHGVIKSNSSLTISGASWERPNQPEEPTPPAAMTSPSDQKAVFEPPRRVPPPGARHYPPARSPETGKRHPLVPTSKDAKAADARTAALHPPQDGKKVDPAAPSPGRPRAAPCVPPVRPKEVLF